MNQIRLARKEDSVFIIPLISISSGGVWPAIWKALAKNGESVRDSALRYLTDSCNDLNTENSVIAELDKTRIGVMVCYQETREELKETYSELLSALPEDLVSALAPYRELSDPDSLFIAELCLLPEARGQGFGTLFLEHAKNAARQRGFEKLTLRVFSTNSGAIRLYQRFGFQGLDEHTLISHPDIEPHGSVLLMSYQL